MDDNTFGLFVLGLGTILVAIVIWQVFTIVRTRMHLKDRHEEGRTERVQQEQQQLESRLTALADDVEALEGRITKLEPPER